MAMIDLDEFLEKKEKISFKIFGKEYTLPELSYALTLKLEELRKKVDKAVKEDDLKGVMRGSMEVITTIIPKLDIKILEDKAALSQLREITRLINKTLLEEEEEKEENKELEHYRNIYKDEFRKKGLEPGRKDLE